jgi:putative holliday junction resolvase
MNKAKLKINKYLGVDWGEARIGLAIGDDETKIAIPLNVVDSVEAVVREAKKQPADILVIGLPQLNFPKIKLKKKLKQTNLDFIKKYDHFVGILKRNLRIPIKFVNENFTTRLAESLPGDKKTKAKQDAISAMLILQTYFDKQQE